MKIHLKYPLPLVCIMLAAGCGSMKRDTEKSHESQWASVQRLVAVIYPTAGNSCSGTVTFENAPGGGVKITADIAGLTPNAEHAFHIHDFGDARKPDGTGAGSHYNPEGHSHGRPEDPMRHAGDFGNLKVDADGRAHYERVDQVISLVGLQNPILGRAVIVHAGRDKFTQPTGDAGGRIGIGVIGIASPPEAAK